MIPYFYLPEINFGFFALPVYPLMHGLAFVVLGILFLREARRKGLNQDKFFKVFLWAFVGGVVGARLGGIFRNWEYFTNQPNQIFNLAQGGWTESGGFILAFALALAYIKFSGLPLKQSVDAAAPALAARFAIARIGCSALHDHIGKIMASSWPWGISYFGEVRHETGMYSLLANTLLFILLWNLRKKIKTPGLLFAIYLFGYSLSVFIIRFFRAEDLPQVSDPRYFGLTITQYIAIGVFILAVGLLMHIFSKRSRPQQSLKI